MGTGTSRCQSSRAIVPVWPGAKPLLGKGADDGVGWYDFLTRKALVTFDLPGDAFTRNGKAVTLSYGYQAVVAAFNYTGRFKAKRRPEKYVRLQRVPEMDGRNYKVPAIPVLLTRVSPMAEEWAPSMADDTMASASRRKGALGGRGGV